MHGMLLMILDFNQTNRSIPIDQPLPFRDASPNSEKTYLFDSQGGEVFWFSKTLQDGLVVNIIDHERADDIRSINIANDSALSEHILTDRFEKRQVMFREEFLYQFLTGVPKLLTVEKGKLEYIIFSHH